MIAFAVFFSAFMAAGAVGCMMAVVALLYLLLTNKRGPLGTVFVVLTVVINLACGIGGGVLCAAAFQSLDYRSPIAMGLISLAVVQLILAVVIGLVARHTSKRNAANSPHGPRA